MKASFTQQAHYTLALLFLLHLTYTTAVNPPTPPAPRPNPARPLLPKLRPLCHGPAPSLELNGADISGYDDLTDWCVRGPQDCSCVENPSTHAYEVVCNWGPTSWLPVSLCHERCQCEKHDIDAFIAALERALPPLDENGRDIA